MMSTFISKKDSVSVKKTENIRQEFDLENLPFRRSVFSIKAYKNSFLQGNLS
jgi:hypothetical protein